jgi:hypothetical protein
MLADHQHSRGAHCLYIMLARDRSYRVVLVSSMDNSAPLITPE